MRAEAGRYRRRLGARLPAPRRRRPAERRRLVQPRRPPGLDRAPEGRMGDDRPGAPRLVEYSRDGPPEGTLAIPAVFCTELSAIEIRFAGKPWFFVGIKEEITAKRTAE